MKWVRPSHLNWQPHADSTYSELLKQFSSDIGIMCLTVKFDLN